MTYTCSLLAINPDSLADIKKRIAAVNQTGDYDHMFHNAGEHGQGIDMTHIMIVADPAVQPVAQQPEYSVEHAMRNILRSMEEKGHGSVTIDLADMRKLMDGGQDTVFNVSFGGQSEAGRRSNATLERAIGLLTEIKAQDDAGYLFGGPVRDAVASFLETEDGITFQSRVARWLHECFGDAKALDVIERTWRFGEEALELLQALDIPKEDVLKLVDYVYGREKGEPGQEVGGVMNTLAALCHAAGMVMMFEGFKEIDRINRPEVMQRIRDKQAAKDKAGLYTNTSSPLPGQPEEA